VAILLNLVLLSYARPCTTFSCFTADLDATSLPNPAWVNNKKADELTCTYARVSLRFDVSELLAPVLNKTISAALVHHGYILGSIMENGKQSLPSMNESIECSRKFTPWR